MKVLVAGGCGFLGSHVCELFKENKWSVVVLDNLSKYELKRTDFNVYKARNYNTRVVHDLGNSIIVGDIRDIDTVRQAAKECNYIINCAAQPAMTIALEDPAYDCYNNVLGTLNLLQAARENSIPFITCSTIHVYGNGLNSQLIPTHDKFLHTLDYNEDEPVLTGEITPLHVSKYTSELYTRAFTESYGLKAASLRLTGFYGPRQFGGEDHGWVANFAIRTILNRPIKIFGTDLQARDILYVTDVAKVFLDWYNNGQPSGIYNIGGGPEFLTSLKQCLDMLKAYTGHSQDINILPARKGDLWYFCCNSNLAGVKFGWHPTIAPTQGLPRLVEWIEVNKELFIND